MAGLASSGYVFELISYTIFASYNSRKGYAFSTFGENVFLCFQNLAILYCFLIFPATKGGTSPLSGAKAAMAALAALAVYAAGAAAMYASITPVPPSDANPLSSYEMALVTAPNVLVLAARQASKHT